MSCPICGSETVPAYRPFCSKRCADLDLAKWLNGSYAIPSSSDEEDEALDDEAETQAKLRH
ncbi:DNA gyrase inhibitor YacG [Ruegeria pomeroyi]|uniref:DNA gyrase inhibitor YacG n=1 Tax=Ruegeria pomeroyi TaxID=89184 RepID=UPI001F417967|nr:DNA gyrase inhibitor YacG [Ruegeria pomeroyi]MCE8509204.1 DNA gyrase inhibitor YacG [Ruegeria pomeroyi]